jgi:hypothetical protein
LRYGFDMTDPDDKRTDDATGFAEQAAPFSAALDLGPDVDRLLAEAEADFREGRTMTLEEFSADLKAYLSRMRERS